ncbi:MAG: hypothetical protein JRD05_00615 [Deltaproteobacteria bacterium]|nr:hypothetical protein [Deltaproteobacteria bacterium]
MRLEDLGVDSKTGHHNKTLTHTENSFLGLLWIDHIGEGNKISADELALRFHFARSDRKIRPWIFRNLMMSYKKNNPKKLSILKRDVRRIHNHLLTQHDHTPILSKAGHGGGYWIADSEEEAAEFYNTFRQRGLTGLVKASRGKKAVIVEMMSQLSFEFEDLVDKSGVRDQGPGIRRRGSEDGAPAAIAVVDAFLERMLRNPEQYSEDLKKIGKKFGSVLLPKDQVAAMQLKAAELKEILEGLTG